MGHKEIARTLAADHRVIFDRENISYAVMGGITLVKLWIHMELIDTMWILVDV